MQEALRGWLPKLNNGFKPLFSSPAPGLSFPFTGTEPGSQAAKGFLAGRLRVGVKKLWSVSLKGSQVAEGRTRTPMTTFIQCFQVPRPVLSALHELAPFIPIGNPARQ